MRLGRVLLVVALCALTACTDGVRTGGPGTLTVTLESPNGDEGAAVLLLVGEGIGDVRSLGRTEAYAGLSEDGVRVVLLNRVGGVLSFELTVGHRGRPPAAVIEQVAGPDDELRADVGAYRVELR